MIILTITLYHNPHFKGENCGTEELNNQLKVNSNKRLRQDTNLGSLTPKANPNHT
jgi:hypothetical protein